MRKILITEKQKKHLKKAIAAQDQVGGKVRVLSPGMVCEDNGEVITLYHGVMAKNLEFNIENGGFIPRVCSEGGPSAVWLSQKMYGYQFIFKFDIPVDQVSQMTNVDYIYTDAIPFDSFNCELVKTNILVDYDGLCAEVNLLNRNLLSNQLRILPDLISKLQEMFSAYPGVYEKFVKPYLPGGTLSESVNSEIETWYRGYNPKFGLYGADTPYMLWLTTDLEYAKEYAKHFNGAVMEFQIDMSRCNGGVYDLPEEVDYYDGPDQETANELLADGINSYCFWANQDESYCMCLWSTEPIVSQRQLPMNEDVDTEKYQIGFEPGGFEPNGHIINETNDRFNGESFNKNSGAITFITFADNPVIVHYTTERGMTHGGFTKRLMKTGVIPSYEFNDKATIKADVRQTGRYWVGQNTISFWTTPALPGDRDKLRNVVEQLGINKNTLDIDFWDTKNVINVNSQFVVPYKWFFNGTFDDLLKMGAYSITKRSENTYFVMFGDFKRAYLDRDGNMVNTLNEDREWCENFNYKPYLKSLADFLVEKGINVKPYPRVILHHKEQEGLYIKTGYYDPDAKEVHLFIRDRHPKDVLRSFVHEMIHHNQNLRGVLSGYKGQTLDGDDILQKLESEAYLLGNIYFRKWTEELRPELPGRKQKLNESIQDIYNIAEDFDVFGASKILGEFLADRKKGINKKHWDLIPASQYQNLLSRYMQDPIMARIPDNIVYNWFLTVVQNAFDIEAITELAGHTQWFPYDEVQSELDYTFGEGEYDIHNYDDGFKALDGLGFYEWCSLPDGSDGWSDYGIEPIFKELAYYKPGMSAGDLLVLINRVLHVGHCRGDLASAFIEGGSRSCSAISGIVRESVDETKWNGDGDEWKGLEPAYSFPKFLYHATDSRNRERILRYGLQPRCGYEYSDWWSFEGPNGEEPDDDDLPELVFLSDKPYTWYDNIVQNGKTDIYQIDTSQLDLEYFFYDPDKYQRRQGSYCYSEVIPPSALRLINNGENISENTDISEISSPNSIDLSSFDINDQLNPRFWKDGRIDSRIRVALLDIADDFIDTLDVSWVKPSDIVITGSMANYNWSKEHSDIDLHVIMDFSKVDDNTALVKDYFDSKRRIWNDEHSGVTVAGFPVELYVQDIKEPHSSSGIYSLEDDRWIVKPSHDELELDYDEGLVKEKVSEYMNEIDELENEYGENVADCDLSELHDKVVDVFKRIKDERKKGFEQGGGEYNTGNVIFKALRRNGYIGKVNKLRTDTYDSLKSLLNEK